MLNKLALAVAIAAAPLAGCTANQMLESAPIVGNVCAAADRTLIDENVVIGAQTLYLVAGDAFLQAVEDGHLPAGDLKENLRAKLVKMHSLQNAIRAARGSVNCDFAAMKELHAEVLALIPRS